MANNPVLKVIGQITVEPLAFLYMFAIFGEFSTYQDLLWERVCSDYFMNNGNNSSSSSTCTISKASSTESQALAIIQARSADQLLYNNIAMTCSSIVGSFMAGSYGDINGRLLPLTFPPLLSLVAQVLYLCSAYYMSHSTTTSSVNVLAMLTACQLLGGISGASISLLANCFGYISDITDPKSRTRRMIAIEASVFVGQFLGSISTGFILKQYNNSSQTAAHSYTKYYVCFGLFLGIHTVLVIYNWLRLSRYPVSHIQQRVVRQSKSRFSAKSVYKLFSDVLSTVFRRRESNNRRVMFLIFGAFIMITYASEVMTSLMYLYVRNRPLLWQSSDYSFYNGIKFGVTGAALLVLPAVQLYVWPTMGDITVAVVGVVSRTAGLVLIGFATNGAMMYSSVALLMFSEYPLPIIRSLLSKLVAPDERGKVFAFLTLWYNLCSLTGGIVFPLIYKHSLKTGGYTGICFQLAAGFQLVAIGLLM
ncbi:solute carrier family 46 member 3-like [Oppia nitens]|uniref:solute carrier family 46 member 3-like n=1 Tax=Oppia nitens TaxID=1686743 RepID=UPI0023DCB551|nr:solute carrier family 46 member 3-like [Oppia nitens]